MRESLCGILTHATLRRVFLQPFHGSGIHETPALKEEEEIRSTRVLEKSAEHIKANAHTMYMHM